MPVTQISRIGIVTATCLAVLFGIAGCAPSSVSAKSAATVGTCSSGALFIVPDKVTPGEVVRASASANCTPGQYRVDIMVVGALSNALILGKIAAKGSGGMSGSLVIPKNIGLGYARAFVIANFSCHKSSSQCSSGIAGTVVIS